MPELLWRRRWSISSNSRSACQTGTFGVAVYCAEISRFAFLLFQQPEDTGVPVDAVTGVEERAADVAGNSSDVDLALADRSGNGGKSFGNSFVLIDELHLFRASWTAGAHIFSSARALSWANSSTSSMPSSS